MKHVLSLLCLLSILDLTATAAPPPPLTIAIDQTYFCQSGQYFVDVTVTGGVPEYLFQWSTGLGSFASTEDVNLYGGTYWVNVIDQELNQVTQEVHVGLSANITPSSCIAALGEIDLDVTSLLAPMSITWFGPDGFDDQNNDPVVSGLAPGYYEVEVVEANGCIRYQNFWVNPADLNVTIESIIPSGFSSSLDPPPGQECNVGSVDITINGNNSPYSMVWEPGGTTTEDLANVNNGFYYLQVVDDEGCAFHQPGIHVPLDWILSLTATTIPSPTCGTGGTIDLSVSGGTPSFSYLWTNGATTEDITNAVAGTHLVNVIDANGCARAEEFYVDGTQKSVDFTAAITGTCGGQSEGAVDITMTGGVEPFQYYWGGPDNFSANTEDIPSLAPGDYGVTVVDAIGCWATDVFTVPLMNPFKLNALLSPSCNSTGSIDLSVDGSSGPFEYLWWPSGQMTQDIGNVPNGFYTVTVTDQDDCQVSANWYLGATPMNLNTTTVHSSCYTQQNGSIDLTVIFGAPPFQYLWTNGATTQDLAGLAPGT